MENNRSSTLEVVDGVKYWYWLLEDTWLYQDAKELQIDSNSMIKEKDGITREL